MWFELDFVLDENAQKRLFSAGEVTTTSIRKCLAALNSKYGIGLPSQAFGYADPQTPSNNPHDMLSFMVLGGRNAQGIRLIATGMRSCGALDICAQAIRAALIMEGRSAVSMFKRSGQFSAQWNPFPVRYVIPEMVVGDKGKNGLWCTMAQQVTKTGASWLEVADRRLPRTIADSIASTLWQLQDTGEDVEGSIAEEIANGIARGSKKADVQAQLREEIKVQVQAVRGFCFLEKEYAKASVSRVLLKGVEFTAWVDLSGPYFIGREKLRGKGRVFPARRETQQVAEEKYA